MRTMALKDIMGEYLDSNDSGKKTLLESMPWSTGPASECPISPSPSQWEIVSDPTRFMKKFEFASFPRLKNFLSEVLEYQEHIQHHAKITIDYLSVTIEVYTHDVNEVTEIDQEYVHEVENILRDVQHYSEEDNIYV